MGGNSEKCIHVSLYRSASIEKGFTYIEIVGRLKMLEMVKTFCGTSN